MRAVEYEVANAVLDAAPSPFITLSVMMDASELMLDSLRVNYSEELLHSSLRKLTATLPQPNARYRHNGRLYILRRTKMWGGKNRYLSTVPNNYSDFEGASKIINSAAREMHDNIITIANDALARVSGI